LRNSALTVVRCIMLGESSRVPYVVLTLHRNIAEFLATLDAPMTIGVALITKSVYDKFSAYFLLYLQACSFRGQSVKPAARRGCLFGIEAALLLLCAACADNAKPIIPGGLVRHFHSRLLVALMLSAVLSVAAAHDAKAGGCGGGGASVAAGAQAESAVKEVGIMSRDVAAAAVAMNDSRQHDTDDYLRQKAREVLELARKYEELARVAEEKLGKLEKSYGSGINGNPVSSARSRLEDYSQKVKTYKEQALAVLS
jgi:hypothetical protein